MIHNSDRRIARIALVLAVLVTAGMLAVGTAVAASHVTTLVGDDTDVIEDFAGDDDQFIEYTLDADDTDFGSDGTDEVSMNISYDDYDHYQNTSVEVDGADTAATFNLSHADLDTLPGQINEATTVNVTAWGEDDDGNVSTGPSEFEVDIEFSEERSLIFVEDDDHSAVDVEAFEAGLFSWSTLTFWSEAEEPDTYHIEDERDVVGNETTVHIKQADDNMTDAFDQRTEVYDGAGTPVLGMTVLADGELVPVFNEERNDDFVGESDTYAVYDSGDIVIHIGDDFDEDGESIDVQSSNTNALDEEIGMTIEDVEGAFADELAVGDLRDEFSVRQIGFGTWVASFFGFIGFTAATIGFVTLRRREPMEK